MRSDQFRSDGTSVAWRRRFGWDRRFGRDVLRRVRSGDSRHVIRFFRGLSRSMLGIYRSVGNRAVRNRPVRDRSVAADSPRNHETTEYNSDG
jgi:hypothetical protein